MSGTVYRVLDFDNEARDQNLGPLSLGEVEELFDRTLAGASNVGWESTLKLGSDIYIYFVEDADHVWWGECRDHVRDSFHADTGELEDPYDDWFEFESHESEDDFVDYD